MKGVELNRQVRHSVRVDGLSRRETGRRFGLDPRKVAKMLAFSVPPGYRRSRPPARPKLDPFVGLIDRVLEYDKTQPVKQRHTSKRIFERLWDEYGYGGGLTIVKDYVLLQRQRQREMFVPLRHDPGHAQADFGEALAVIGGVERKIHFFAMDRRTRMPASCRLIRRRRQRRSVPVTWRRSTSSARCRSRSCTTTPGSRWRGWRSWLPSPACLCCAVVPPTPLSA